MKTFTYCIKWKLRTRAKHIRTFAAALHMSATILPDTHVSKMFEVAKLNTFCNAT